MKKIIAIAKYQASIDLRSGKTYVIFAAVLFLSTTYTYLIPKFARGYLFNYASSPYAWMETSSAIFTTIVSGLAAVLVGGLTGSDVLSEEFETGSISRLISLPIKRSDIYFGKLLEKLTLILTFSTIIVAIALLSSSLLTSSPGFLIWIVPFLISITLAFIAFTSLGFLFGPLLRRTSTVFGAIMGIWMLFIILYGITIYKSGMGIDTFAIPFFNAAILPTAVQSYVVNPSGVLHFTFYIASSSRSFTVSRLNFLVYTVLFSSLETALILALGFFIFLRKQILG